MFLSIRLAFALAPILARTQTVQEDMLLAAARNGNIAAVKQQLAARAPVDARDKKLATPLMLAAQGGHLAVVRELIAAKADPNAKDGMGRPVLFYASGVQQPSIISDLVAAGARVDEKESEKDTLLLKAAANGDAALVDALVTHGANPNVRDKDGNTPLIRCAWWTQYDLIIGGKEEQHAMVVDELTAQGADPNNRGQDGITALMRAAGWSHTLTMKALLKAGADPNVRDDKGRSALTWAARNTYRREDYIQPLLDKGAKLGVTDALLMGDLKKARDLIEQAGDLSVPGGFDDTPLMIACEWGDLETVNALLRRKVNVNARDSEGNTALMIAAAGRPGVGQGGRYFGDHDVKKGRGAVIRTLAAAGATIDAVGKKMAVSDGETALTLAISAKNMESALALIAAGAKPNGPVRIYSSLLEQAAGQGEDAVVLALLKAGAEVSASKQNPSPLERVAMHCKPETLRAMIKAGAPINAAGWQGITPVMGAAWQGKEENVRILLDRGAQIDSRSNDGNSALSVALDEAPKSGVPELLLERGAKVGLLESLLLGNRTRALALIRSGADLSFTSHRDYTPLIIACEWGDLEIIRALLNRGAKIAALTRSRSVPLILAACGRDDIVFDDRMGYRSHYEWFDHGIRGKARIPIIRELLGRGARINESDDLESTALERSSAKGDLEIMTFLMDHGADPNYAPPKREYGIGNRVPLIAAAYSGQLEAVKLLLSRGANINAGSGDVRTTPLTAAVAHEHVEVVRRLLEKGADASIRGSDGWSPLQTARERKNQAIINLLKAAKPKE